MQPFEISPAEPSDFNDLDGPPQLRVRAVTGRVGDEIIGIGGLVYLPDGLMGAFARLTPEARRRKVQLHKTALAMLESARARGIRQIVATADPTEPAAERWLERLGFRYVTTAADRKTYLWSAP